MSPIIDSRYEIRFPQSRSGAVTQDSECVEVKLDGSWREIRFHDYTEIYGQPGLYEQLFRDELECVSPQVVVDALAEQADEASELSVLDVGAGNGMVGERLRALDVKRLVGIDIIDAAAAAAERDRPDTYDDYVVADLTDLAPGELDERFDAMVTVAALGFGDIPPAAFAAALDRVVDGGLVGITIKEEFLDEGEFATFVGGLLERGVLAERSRRRYQHRLSVTGEPLHYVAIIAEKCASVPSVS